MHRHIWVEQVTDFLLKDIGGGIAEGEVDVTAIAFLRNINVLWFGRKISWPKGNPF
jgi:hypothetical protein